MFFALSKILHFLLLPLNWLFVLLFLWFIVPVRRKKMVGIITILFLYVYSTDVVLNPLLKTWEYPSIWFKDIAPIYDAAIVLGGMAAPGKMPDDRTHFPGSPDRLLHAIQLYKLGKVKKIIISGGSGELIGKRIPEADYLRKVLLLANVPLEDILVESESRNTRENAAFSKALLQKQFSKDARFLLVTSAWHMRRSMACFKKEGLDVTPFSTDSQIAVSNTLLNTLIPNPTCFSRWNILIHEIVGYITYKGAGYI